MPISTENHRELNIFKRHLYDFTGLVDIALSKGLGKSLDISIARVHKAVSGGIDTGCTRTARTTHHAVRIVLFRHT